MGFDSEAPLQTRGIGAEESDADCTSKQFAARTGEVAAVVCCRLMTVLMAKRLIHSRASLPAPSARSRSVTLVAASIGRLHDEQRICSSGVGGRCGQVRVSRLRAPRA